MRYPHRALREEGVVSHRMAALLDELAVRRTAGLDEFFARHCADVLGVDGLAVTLSGGAPSQQNPGGEPVWFSGPAGIALEDLQFTLGEGPSTDALRTGRLVLEGDLDLVAWERWPGFLPAAEKLGVRAVFAVPLQIGAILLGVLTCHRADSGSLDQRSLAGLLVFSDALTLTLLDSTEPTGPGTGSWLSVDTSLYRAEVHQATGMISERLGVPPATALVRLRAYAFASEEPILEVARDVVARRLHFTSDGTLRDGDGAGTAR